MNWFGFVLLWAGVSSASAQFVIPYYAEDGVDAAAYGRGIAQGAVFVVPAYAPFPDSVVVSGLPLKTVLDGVSLRLTAAGGGPSVRPWILHVGSGQVAAVLPSDTPPGDYALSLIVDDATINTFSGHTTRVVRRKYRSLTNNQEGSALAVAQTQGGGGSLDRNMFATGTINGQTRAPARAGQAAILWGLGLGPIPGPDNTAPGLVDMRNQVDVRVSVGGVPAVVTYAGRAPQSPGIDQIHFTIPPDAPTGCAVLVEVTVDAEASNPVTMAIASPGADTCEHPFLSRQQLDALDQGEKLVSGEFQLTVSVEPMGEAIDAEMVEIHGAWGYIDYMTASVASRPDLRSIAPGRCVAFRSILVTALPYIWSSADAGTVRVSGPGLPGVPLDGDDDYYFQVFSASLESGQLVAGTEGHRLEPGMHTLRADGGQDVAAFEASLDMPPLLKWTNRDGITEVRRNSGVSLEWTGGGPRDTVVAFGAAEAEDDVTMFLCAVPKGAKSFTVPPSILRFVPLLAGQSIGVLGLAGYSGEG
ncbi:MAG: hypothetical protein SFV51_20415, partial [Bryobacteraceae bacterium]|nr:hypothetical protein [Bryobacteraceae bacterium]